MHMQCKYPKPTGGNPLPSSKPTKGGTLYRHPFKSLGLPWNLVFQDSHCLGNTLEQVLNHFWTFRPLQPRRTCVAPGTEPLRSFWITRRPRCGADRSRFSARFAFFQAAWPGAKKRPQTRIPPRSLSQVLVAPGYDTLPQLAHVVSLFIAAWWSHYKSGVQQGFWRWLVIQYQKIEATQSKCIGSMGGPSQASTLHGDFLKAFVFHECTNWEWERSPPFLSHSMLGVGYSSQTPS